MNEQPKKWTKGNVPRYDKDDNNCRVEVLCTVVYPDLNGAWFCQTHIIKIDGETVYTASFNTMSDDFNANKVYENWVERLEN